MRHSTTSIGVQNPASKTIATRLGKRFKAVMKSRTATLVSIRIWTRRCLCQVLVQHQVKRQQNTVLTEQDSGSHLEDHAHRAKKRTALAGTEQETMSRVALENKRRALRVPSSSVPVATAKQFHEGRPSLMSRVWDIHLEFTCQFIAWLMALT